MTDKVSQKTKLVAVSFTKEEHEKLIRFSELHYRTMSGQLRCLALEWLNGLERADEKITEDVLKEFTQEERAHLMTTLKKAEEEERDNA